MKKILTAILLSFFGFTAYAQDDSEKSSPEISRPSCLSICGKEFLRNLDDNREVLFEKNKTSLTQETRNTIAEILRLLSEKDIRQKVTIVITGYADKGSTKIKEKEAMQRAEAIKRYFILYGFPHQQITTEIKSYVKCNNEAHECVKYSRKVNINTKGLSEEKVQN